MSGYGPVANASLPRKVVERILRMIADGEIKVAESLPNENDLAEQLGVSRMALREATQVLKVLGVIKSVPGRGTVILPTAPYATFEQLSLLLSIAPESLLHMLEARAVVERAAARLAAERASEEEVAALRASLERQEELANDPENWPREDARFHTLLVAASQNPVLAQMLNSIAGPLESGRRGTAAIPGRLAKALEFHRRLVAAIAAHDPERAEQLMSDHLKDVAADVRALAGTGGSTEQSNKE